MATNKNQHYVPRCHLKPFTWKEQGLAIDLFNIDGEIGIAGAPVKNQCSKDYFYGQNPEIENTIQFLESKYAEVVRRIRASDGRIGNEDSRFLLRYWIFQHLRTEAAQQSVLSMARAVEDATGIQAPQLLISEKEATLTALGAFAKNFDAILDLNLVVVDNRTSAPFITSDNPAVQTNRWIFAKADGVSANFGMISAGFVGLLPLTPRFLALLYDKDMYSVAHSRKVVVVRDIDDVHALNEHQLLNCLANVYFANGFDQPDLSRLQEIKVRRGASGTRAFAFERRKGDPSERYYRVNSVDTSRSGEALVMTSNYYPCPLSWPHFLNWRPSGYYFTNGSGLGQIRRSRAINRPDSAPFRKVKTGR